MSLQIGASGGGGGGGGVSQQDLDLVESRAVLLERTFVETDGAGTYEATIEIPAGAVIVAGVVRVDAPWTSAADTFDVVDEAVPGSPLYSGAGILAFATAAPLNLGAIDFGPSGPLARTITAQIVTTDSSGDTGRTSVLVAYMLAQETIAAVKS